MQRAKVAVRVAFLTNGFTVGALVSRLPDFKIQLNANTAEVGRLLFCVSLGVLFTLSFIGKTIARRGSKPIVIFGSVASALALIPVAFSKSAIQLAVAFFLFGIGITIQDVAMNTHAATLEHETGQKLMSNFHALFSVGALTGGLVGGVFSQFEITIRNQCLFLVILFLIAAYLVKNLWLPAATDIH
jgi:MFS family permease